AVIEPQPCRHGERLTASQSLGCRQQDLFLHADMLQQARAELGVGGTIDQASLSQGPLEQSVETGMIFGQHAVERSRHGKYPPSQHLTRVDSSSWSNHRFGAMTMSLLTVVKGQDPP